MTLPTIPLFFEQLGGNDQLIGFIVGTFTISSLVIRPWSGQALEKRGRRFVYMAGLVIFVLSIGSYALTVSFLILFSMRLIQGAGWGILTTAGGTIATDLIPFHRRGEGMGYFGLSGSLAMAIGPGIGLALVSLLDFSTLFMIAAALGAGSFILASFIQYQSVEQHNIKKKKWDFYEKSALIPSFLLFFITVTFGGIATFLPLYTVQEGISGIEWYFFFNAISLMVVRVFCGRVYDRRGHKAIFIPGSVLIIGAMIVLIFLSNEWMLVAAAILYGMGFGAIQPALQAWAVNQAPIDRKGMANATFFSFLDLGIGCGAVVFGMISKWVGYSGIYTVAALSVSISILLYLIFLKKEERLNNRVSV